MREDDPDLSPESAQRLRAYGALDNPFRLRAYRIIHDTPDVPFNELVRGLGVASGLAAYHLAVLKAAGLVEVQYVRAGLATSRYTLTGLGTEIYAALFGSRRRGAKRLTKSTSRVLA